MDAQLVWEKYGDRLRKFLLSRVKTSEDADDLLQDILIKTHQNISSLNEPKKFQAWLFKVARNTLYDYYRKPVTSVSGQTHPDFESLVDKYPDSQEIIREELSKCINPFIQSLPQIYREAVEAVDLKGFSQKALAKELGISYSAMKSRVQRAREMLAVLFQSCCTYELDSQGKIIAYHPNSNRC